MKKLTDSHGEQVFKRNQKISNEWSLLNNLYWSQAGDDFSLVTFGGYTLITGAFFISRLLCKKFEYSTFEKLLLFGGIAFFLTEACLVFAAWEYIPTDIQANALILGGLSAVGAILFFIDFCYKSSPTSFLSKGIQTDLESFFTKETPKSASQTQSPLLTNIQSSISNTQVYVKSKQTKCQGCCERKNFSSKKTRVLQTDV